MSEPNIAAVNLREARYDTLFLGELPYEPMPEEAYVGIAGLCRVTNTSRKRSDALNEHLDKLPGIIDNILLNHDIAARQDQAAIFGFIKPETRQDVSTIVSDIFKKWEITHDRQGLGTLVDSAYTPARWLVIETAAAVVQVVGENSHNFKLSNKTDGAKIASIIASWGPRFAKQWFDGSIITEWAKRQAMTPEETAAWLEVITPSIRKRLAVGNINDPLKALDKIKANLRVLSDSTSIAKRLGWSEAEVEEVLNPSIRKHLAVHNINDPLKGLDKIKANLRVLSDTSAIAKRLGWSEAEVEEVLNPSIRKYLAVGNINDPLKALDKIKANLRVLSDTSAIAKRLGWSEAEVEEVFTPGIRKYLAVHNINDPLKALDKIKANLETLSDIPAIAKRLGWREAEVEKVLTLSTRKHLAVHNINDPLKGLVDLVNRNKLIH